MAQAQNDPKNANKPANIIEKMITGRLAKELKEVCLLEQAYVKDGDLTVAKYIEQVAKENGAKLSVKKFVRFETGEGLKRKLTISCGAKGQYVIPTSFPASNEAR